jgi:hypothetical protein
MSRPLSLSQLRDALQGLSLEQHKLQVLGLLASAAGRPVDILYSKLGGIIGPFFPGGWGNLGVVNFTEDVQLIQASWPPPELKARGAPAALHSCRPAHLSAGALAPGHVQLCQRVAPCRAAAGLAIGGAQQHRRRGLQRV